MTSLLLILSALALQEPSKPVVLSDLSYRASCQAGVSSALRLLNSADPSLRAKALSSCGPRAPKGEVTCGCEAGVAAAFDVRGLKWGPRSRQAPLVADAVAACHATMERRK